ELVAPVAPRVGAGIAEVVGGRDAERVELVLQVVGAEVGARLDDATDDDLVGQAIGAGQRVGAVEGVVHAGQAVAGGDVEIQAAQTLGVDVRIVLDPFLRALRAPHVHGVAAAPGLDGQLHELRAHRVTGLGATAVGGGGLVQAGLGDRQGQHGGARGGQARDG